MEAPSNGNEAIFRQSMNRGHSAAWEGRWEEAAEHYDRALTAHPDNSSALNSLALARLELGDLDEALELYHQAASLSPEDPLPLERMAQIYKQTGSNAEAVQYSMRAAELYLKIRDVDKAINNWTRVLQLDPEHLDAHSRLALVYEKLDRTNQAITEYITIASLFQHQGDMQQAESIANHALSLDSNNKEAQQAVDLLKSFQTLPRPVRSVGLVGDLQAPSEKKKPSAKRGLPDFEEGPDPVEEARQVALQSLADMLFDLRPGEGEESKESGGLRSFARVVTGGLLARSFDEQKIAQHLNEVLQMQTQQKFKQAAEALRRTIEAGLDHPAAHFYLGLLQAEENRLESAQRSLQRAVKHADYALAARLLIADHLYQQGRLHDAAVQYLRALGLADSAVVPQEQAEGLRRQYEPLIEAASQGEDEADLEQLSRNIQQLLMRPSWRAAVTEARSQLPSPRDGSSPQPLADILTQANSGRLVDAMTHIARIAREGRLRAALEEVFTALSFAPNYLPLHITMGELLLMQGRSRRAIAKFSNVARLYSARGESDRALQMYQRIVSVSPLDVNARQHLIEQMSAHGEVNEAVKQSVELADVYYRQAMLDLALTTYDNALRLVKSTEADSSWNEKILQQMADIYLQRLDWRMALRVYEQLRTLNPDDEDVRLYLVQLNLRLGQESKATAELDSYLSHLTSNSREADAGNFLQTLVEENEDFILAGRRLAEFHQQAGDQDEAIKEWNKVGELLVARGDREGAKAAVRAIISMNPPDMARYQEFLRRLSE